MKPCETFAKSLFTTFHMVTNSFTMIPYSFTVITNSFTVIPYTFTVSKNLEIEKLRNFVEKISKICRNSVENFVENCRKKVEKN